MGTVFAVYQLNVGSVAETQATEANHPVLESSRKKAGYTSLAIVAALSLLTHDANVFILGCGSIIAMELSYRHGIMSNPATGRIQDPRPVSSAYAPAENVIPMYQQGETG